MTDFEHNIVRISEEIQRYLLKHPKAADTLAGITHWWLQKQRYSETKISVNNALDFLIKEGLVTKNTSVDSRYIYMSSSNRMY